MLTFQEMIHKLIQYWASKGCAIHQGYDLEVGAGTFNPVTFLRCLGPEPYKAVYVEPSRRPQDGRYGLNPNRVQYYHQMQVIFKPSPYDIQDLYLGSLEAVGLDLSKHDIRFVHDDWENPTIGASGLGWEIWIDGMEATQFTYFQTVGGISVKPVTAEITYGLERLAMYLQQVDSIFDIHWNNDLLYGEIYQNSEWQWSYYNFEEATVPMWQRHFADFESEARRLIEKNLPIPAYDFVMKTSHAFNILDARGSISVSERARIMGKIRSLAHDLALIYIASREKAQFPLLKEKATPLPSEPSITPPSFVEGAKEDFLLEIGCEELPAAAIEPALAHFKELISQFFHKSRLSFDEILTFATPRRLALQIKGLLLGLPAEKSEKKGPKISAAFDEQGLLTSVGEGFVRSVGANLQSLSEVKNNPSFDIRTIKGEETLYATLMQPSISTYALLAENLASLILSIDFPKKMRWGDLSIAFSRPIRWLVALLGKEVIPFSIGPVHSGRTSYGHRLKANHSFILSHPSEYEAILESHFVMPSPTKRKQAILAEIEKLEKKEGVSALAKELLLSQVTYLVEWPTVLKGVFDAKYLQAPKEVLVSEMVEHQRYFPLETKEGKLASSFFVVSNNGDSPLIVQGHQKALSPRLADGFFLFEEDLKEPLSHFAQKLEHVTFHTELGSMGNKQRRIGELALLLHSMAPLTENELIMQAALLCKADLTTQLVGEFPHLQGLIGATYLRYQHGDPLVALAIEEHWLPKQEKGALPTSGLGKIISMADKLDNLLSCFALGLKPTASSDPFALRRQAFGWMKMVLEEKLAIDLRLLLQKAFVVFLQNPELAEKERTQFVANQANTIEEILHFIEGRLKTLFTQMGFNKEEVEVVLRHDYALPYQALLKLEALAHCQQKETLVEIYRRTKKIVGTHPKKSVDSKLLILPEEKELFDVITVTEGKLEQEKDYGKALTLLASLEAKVTSFFDHVIVMAPEKELQANRLAILHRLLALFEKVAVF